MADVKYTNFKKELMEGTIDLKDDTIKVALVTSSYTPNAGTHTHFDDVTNEVSATGYTAGGATLASKTVTTSSTKAVFDAADVSWTITGSVTAAGAVVYKDSGTSSTSPLICYFDFGENKTATDGDFDITWSSSGIVDID